MSATTAFDRLPKRDAVADGSRGVGELAPTCSQDLPMFLRLV